MILRRPTTTMSCLVVTVGSWAAFSQTQRAIYATLSCQQRPATTRPCAVSWLRTTLYTLGTPTRTSTLKCFPQMARRLTILETSPQTIEMRGARRPACRYATLIIESRRKYEILIPFRAFNYCKWRGRHLFLFSWFYTTRRSLYLYSLNLLFFFILKLVYITDFSAAIYLYICSIYNCMEHAEWNE